MTFLLAPLLVALSGPIQQEPLGADCTVTDGDTLRCGEERIRLLAIDAPEFPGHCRPGRKCMLGDPGRSTETLRHAIDGASLTIERVAVDRYGRTLAIVRADGRNLSCLLLAAGSAVYVVRWDSGQLVAQDCPAETK